MIKLYQRTIPKLNLRLIDMHQLVSDPLVEQHRKPKLALHVTRYYVIFAQSEYVAL
jgi:hypothetical protein